MISPVDLVKRVGVGGRLVPFFKCVCVYFVAMGAGAGESGAGPSPGAVAAKCAPVLCLLLVVLLHHAALPQHKGGYARRVAAGLALSALGDALLLWPQHFVAGMAAFALAHVAYIAALGWQRRAPALGAALYAATGCFLTCVAPPGALRALVPAYALLLATMAWRGVARGGAAAPGALLFLASDAILGYSLFGGPVPHKQVLVMSTYYLAQLGLALSALWAADEAASNDETMQDDITAMQLHVPLESHDVQENTEITPEVPIQLAQDDSPQLDPQLLSALGDTTDELPVYGENIHHTLAQRWIPLLKKGLAKDLKEKLLKEYQIPENCKLLRAPTLNPEIKAAVPEIVISRDKNIQLKQDQLGLGISALNKAITQLLLTDEKVQAIKILSDSCRILTDLHYTETQVRTKLLTPCLDKSFTPLIKEHERDETLFGEKLSETIKASKAIERQGSLIKKSAQRATSFPAPTAGPSTARTRFSGNGTGCPRYVSTNRGGRGGYPRTAAAYRRQPTTMRPRAAPSQGKHRAQTRR